MYEEQIGGEKIKPEKITIESGEAFAMIALGGRRYFSSTLPQEHVIEAFENAKLTI